MKKSVLVLITCIAIYSCKKKDEATPPLATPAVVYADYSNLRTGNYWIYERFSLDTALVTYTSLNIFDSSYVEKDTVINGNTYFKLMQINYPYNNEYAPVYLRDSLNYIVNISGDLQFASQNFIDTFYTHYIVQGFNDTICYIFSKMADDNLSITVPAGTFVTKNFKTTYLMYPNYSFGLTERPVNYRYTENVGLVEQTLPIYTFPAPYIVRRLKSYGTL
jgi:hypothetical protein